jgi:hypothetical protein
MPFRERAHFNCSQNHSQEACCPGLDDMMHFLLGRQTALQSLPAGSPHEWAFNSEMNRVLANGACPGFAILALGTDHATFL